MYSQLEDSDEWFLRHYHCINEAIVMGQRDEGSPTTRLVPTVERLPLAPLPIAYMHRILLTNEEIAASPILATNENVQVH